MARKPFGSLCPLITKHTVAKVGFYQHLTYTKIVTMLAAHEHELIIIVYNFTFDSSHI